MRGGEIVGLIGPNGAGKSTTFNLLTGVAQATSGEIRFRGERIDRLPARDDRRARDRPHLPAREARAGDDGARERRHRRAPARARRRARVARCASTAREEARIIAEAARQIERVGLAEHMHKAAGSLALGQARVAEIARALALDPALLLLDEPAAGLRFAREEGARRRC